MPMHVKDPTALRKARCSNPNLTGSVNDEESYCLFPPCFPEPQDSGMYECKVLVMAGFDFHAKEAKEQAFIQHIPVSGGCRQLCSVSSL